MDWRLTDWHFITSRGGEITGGSGWQLGATGGSLFLESRSTRRRIELRYGALGAGAGAGIPISIDGATRDTPSGGIGPVLSNHSPNLYPEDFTGLFVMGNLQYSAACEGQSVSAFFFNIPTLSWVLDLTALGRALDALANVEGRPPLLMNSARAMALIWGDNKGLEIGSVGAMYYYGYLSLV